MITYGSLKPRFSPLLLAVRVLRSKYRMCLEKATTYNNFSHILCQDHPGMTDLLSNCIAILWKRILKEVWKIILRMPRSCLRQSKNSGYNRRPRIPHASILNWCETRQADTWDSASTSSQVGKRNRFSDIPRFSFFSSLVHIYQPTHLFTYIQKQPISCSSSRSGTKPFWWRAMRLRTRN
jgi:hypothetical protein